MLSNLLDICCQLRSLDKWGPSAYQEGHFAAPQEVQARAERLGVPAVCVHWVEAGVGAGRCMRPCLAPLAAASPIQGHTTCRGCGQGASSSEASPPTTGLSPLGVLECSFLQKYLFCSMMKHDILDKFTFKKNTCVD